MFEPVKPLRGGGYKVRLASEERRLLRELCSDLRARIERDDGDVGRLFPPAHRTDAQAAAEFEQLARPGLVDGRVAALALVDRTLFDDTLDEDGANTWCTVLNDLRLVLGERLGVTEDLDLRKIGRDDPRAHEYALYVWLTYLQGAFVDALASRL